MEHALSNPRSRKFLVECKLTCLGGSEKGTCGCENRFSCKLQNDPGFQLAREAAIQRMGNFLRNVGIPWTDTGKDET